jgi:hypothetical protein
MEFLILLAFFAAVYQCYNLNITLWKQSLLLSMIQLAYYINHNTILNLEDRQKVIFIMKVTKNFQTFDWFKRYNRYKHIIIKKK